VKSALLRLVAGNRVRGSSRYSKNRRYFMETVQGVIAYIKTVLSVPLLKMGSMQLTLWTLIYLVVLFILLIYLSGKLRILVADRLLARKIADIGIRHSMAAIMRYVVIFVGSLIIFQTAGIDLTALNVLAGAIGIGVGFGLQNIVSNFISGLIILFERPIKVGDRIEVGNIEGDVVRIKGRSTTVVTNDNIAIIVPNSRFTSENVVNWSHTDRTVRFRVPVSVAYDSDVRLVEHLLLEVAAENPDVLERPAPGVRFMKFGDSSLQFELRVWSMTLIQKKGLLVSSLNFGIIEKFRQHGIEIPFPQRDLHIRSGYLKTEAAEEPTPEREDD
jgi:small-conductance mechanosensitive channel